MAEPDDEGYPDEYSDPEWMGCYPDEYTGMKRHIIPYLDGFVDN